MPLLNRLVHVTTPAKFDPTTLISYEAGYRGRPADRFDTSVNVFWHDYDEFSTFAFRLGPPGLLRYELANRSGSVALYGAEFEGKYKASDAITLVGNYTYQQLNWDMDGSIVDRDYLTPPRHKFMLGARYKVNDDLRLGAHLYFVDAVRAPNPANPFKARRIDRYYRLDLNAEYEFHEDRARLTVGVKNLLDSNHYEGGSLFINDAEVPRMFYMELRLSIP